MHLFHKNAEEQVGAEPLFSLHFRDLSPQPPLLPHEPRIRQNHRRACQKGVQQKQEENL